MFLLDTNKVGGDINNATEQLHGLLEKNSAEILASRPWDERRLAYPVDGHKKGLYYLTYFRTDSQTIDKLKRDFALNEMILRSLILKIDPKLVDTMLSIARDEHAQVALQGFHDEPAEEGQGQARTPAAAAAVASASEGEE
jgi:small subunit ribosomal protein S6